ncbi:transposase, partial [Mycobacterium tuberculosis UT0119]
MTSSHLIDAEQLLA